MPRSADLIDAYVGGRVASRRLALGLTLGALSDRIGISFQQLRKYETGSNRISASRLHRIAMETGVSIASFFPEPAQFDPSTLDERPTDLIRTTWDGCAVADAFPLIRDADIRRAVAVLVKTLAS